MLLPVFSAGSRSLLHMFFVFRRVPDEAKDLIPGKHANATSHRRTSTTQFFGYARLSGQALSDLKWWRSFADENGREGHPVPSSIALHGDASDVGLGGTLGLDTSAGSPCFRETRGIWSGKDLQKSIILREWRAIRILLNRSFDEFVSAPLQRIMLHEENASVVTILNAILSTSLPVMSELSNLHDFLRALLV